MAGEIVSGHSSGNGDYNFSIDGFIKKLQTVTSTSTDRNIFKVPAHLRSVNPNAYVPHIIAIGPYHRNSKDLSITEEHKMQTLKEFLHRGDETEEDAKRYVESLREVEKDARKCYAEGAADKGSDEFLTMMLLDACFILELLRRFMHKLMIDCNANQEGDTLSFSSSIIKKLRRDLLLFENQLPFCVLQKLFSISSTTSCLEDMILCFFDYSTFVKRLKDCKRSSENGNAENKHLLSFIHDRRLHYCLEKKKKKKKENGGKYLKFMRCVTELKEAGIKFKKGRGESLFDIKFENGIMKIPRLEITEETESIYRNFIVYEQHCLEENDSKSRRVISDYMKFMDCLVNSHKDVEVLCQRNILHNCLGSDEKVAEMFNSIGYFGTLSPDNYYYDIFLEVNHYCEQKCHRWMAHLRYKYFNTPWAFVSFFAAVLLLLLTLAQTVYSVLSFYK